MGEVVQFDDLDGHRAMGAKHLRQMADRVEAGEVSCLALAAVRIKPEADVYTLHGSYVDCPDQFALLGLISVLNNVISGLCVEITDAK